MTALSRYAAFTVLLVVVSVGTYLLGVKVGQSQSKESFAGVLASVQADLGLNKLVRLRELEADLARGCSKEVLEKVRFDIDLEMYVLSSLYKEHKNSWTMESVSKREPTMPAQLAGFKKKYGDSWSEPKCTK